MFFLLFKNKEVKKLYRALAAAPLPTGIISHYMRPINMAPRLVSEGNCQGSSKTQFEHMILWILKM